MKLLFSPSGEVADFKQMVDELAADSSVEGLMVLACDKNDWTPGKLNPIIRKAQKPVFGGIFPQIIHQRKNWETGVLVVGLPKRPDVVCVSELSDPNIDYSVALEPFAEQWEEYEGSGKDTLLVFVDGLSTRIAAFVEALFFSFGLERNFIGGGAGSLSFQKKPCLIAPTGLVGDAGIVVRLPMRSSLGVAHGWEPISDSMKVTGAERNIIKTLDWRPAFEVYRELVEEHSGRSFSDENFFDIAKCYPFGINKVGSEVVVRDPLLRNENQELICVGEVPKGCFVRLLNGSPESLIAAAAHARELAEQTAPSSASGETFALFMDCISRVLFLGERIVDELETAAGDRELYGALTLGEIADDGRNYLEFYNKTSVLGLLSTVD